MGEYRSIQEADGRCSEGIDGVLVTVVISAAEFLEYARSERLDGRGNGIDAMDLVGNFVERTTGGLVAVIHTGFGGFGVGVDTLLARTMDYPRYMHLPGIGCPGKPGELYLSRRH